MTPKHRGLIFVVDEPNRALHVAEHAQNFGDFTDTLSAHDFDVKKSVIALVSFDGWSFSYAALATRGQRVATAKHVVRFTRLVDLEQLRVETLSEHVPAARMRAVNRFARGGGGVLSENTWHDVWNAVRTLRPDLVSEFDALEGLLTEPTRTYRGKGYETVAQEKDAFLLATEIFGIERRLTSRLLVPPKRPAPFLQGLSTASITEDIMIQKDKGTMPNWLASPEEQVGSVVLTRRDGRQLTVINVNRTAVESTLGVDLIYYNHDFSSFVMVQYKRMEQKRGKDGYDHAVYRPIDDNYKREMARMNAYLAARAVSPPTCQRDFRLSSNGFLFKLCPKISLNPLSTSLIKGMYLPLDYWNLLIQSPKTRGPKGGIKITYDNVDRYLDNSAFVTLVADGWLGSAVSEERDLASLIKSGLEGKRSVYYARVTGQRAKSS